MKKLFFYFFLIISNVLFAQVPGYLGKCNTLLYKSSISWLPFAANNILEPNYWTNFGNTYGSYTPEFEYGRTINRKTSIGLGYSFLSDKIYYNNNELTYNNYNYLPSTVKGGSVKLNLTIFSFKNSGSIAPLGSYVKLFIFGSSTKVVDLHNFEYAKYNCFGGGISAGKNYILFDQILVNYEFEFSAPLSYGNSTGSTYVLSDVHQLYSYSNYVRFNLGIGYLFNDKFDFKRR